ncbi:MAG: hypothetical protein UCH28_03690, partial [Adlercreutzia sp.]|nr:hypothetical protein [Adlercreutzia sp.]
LGVVGFAAFLGTLLGAASLVVCACVARARSGRSLSASLVAATALCGAVVMVLTLGTFGALNTVAIDLPVLGGWFAADLAVNLVMLFGAQAYLGKLGKGAVPVACETAPAV